MTQVDPSLAMFLRRYAPEVANTAACTANAKIELKRLAQRLVTLETEGLRLYQPLPLAERFHATTSKWRVASGSNRSSKTISCACEFARAFTGCDPYDKYVKTGGNALVVGLDEDHLAMQWRKCAVQGAFKVIKDELTGQWRSVRSDPNDPLKLDPYDEAYREKWRDAPPLIPERMLKRSKFAWEDKRKGIPRYVESVTGWRSLWRSSNGKPPQGDAYDLGWLDEEMTNPTFYYELARGLTGISQPLRHLPKAFWSATSQVDNAELEELCLKGEAGSESVSLFVFLIEDNPYIPAAEKQAFLDSLPEDERNMRYHGIRPGKSRRIYRVYDPNGCHGCEPFSIPDNWTRYCCLDPGRTHCGTLFLAVDPQEKHRWVYDGFDLRHGNAQEWARMIEGRQGDMMYEAFIIDQRMGKQHPPGAGMNVAQQYWAALQAKGIRPRVSGPLAGFFPGSDDIEAREEALLSWMLVRGDGPFAGTPLLQVAKGVLPELDKQIASCRIDTRNKTQRKDLPQDLLVCLEYAAGFRPYYHEPHPVREPVKWSPTEALSAKQRRRERVASDEALFFTTARY